MRKIDTNSIIITTFVGYSINYSWWVASSDSFRNISIGSHKTVCNSPAKPDLASLVDAGMASDLASLGLMLEWHLILSDAGMTFFIAVDTGPV